MNTPSVGSNYFQERNGVLRVSFQLNSYGYVFRETPNGDVGIDGQIEHVNANGATTGRIVVAQIKSGDSYLVDKGSHFAFYPLAKHREYWSIFPLPVILFVYYPKDDRIYFTDVRYQLNLPNVQNKYISLSKDHYLNDETAKDVFETSGSFGVAHHSIEQLFDIMVESVCPSPTFNISYLDLFTQGLTNICRHVYFGMDLAMQIAAYNNETEYDVGIGLDEHEFLNNYAKFIMSQNLAYINYSDYLIDWKERQLQPKYFAPITPRGYELLRYIESIQKRYVSQLPPTTLIRERIVEMKFYSADDYQRLELGKRLRRIIHKTNA